jgi:hypothetical protein
MHTSYKELNNGIMRKARRDIKPQTKNSIKAAAVNRDLRI